jgi:hypothetical protein
VTVLLAQDAQAAERLFADILPWIGVLAVLILLGGGVAIWLKKRMAVNRDDSSAGFILADLRGMRDRGEISPEEFEIAKSRMIEGIKASATRDSEKSGDHTKPTPGSARPLRQVAPTVPPRKPASGDRVEGDPPVDSTE